MGKGAAAHPGEKRQIGTWEVKAVWGWEEEKGAGRIKTISSVRRWLRTPRVPFGQHPVSAVFRECLLDLADVAIPNIPPVGPVTSQSSNTFVLT